MKKRANKSGVYAYLDTLGLLENGFDEAIASAKRLYWKQYRYAWLLNKRKNKALTIYFSNSEFNTISKSAKQHKRSNSRFLKEAAMAYVKQTFLVPDILTVNEIKGLLTQIFVELKSLYEDRRLSYSEVERRLQAIIVLESQIIECLTSPKPLSNDD